METTWETGSSIAVSYQRSAVPCHHRRNIKQNRRLHILHTAKAIPMAEETDAEF